MFWACPGAQSSRGASGSRPPWSSIRAVASAKSVGRARFLEKCRHCPTLIKGFRIWLSCNTKILCSRAPELETILGFARARWRPPALASAACVLCGRRAQWRACRASALPLPLWGDFFAACLQPLDSSHQLLFPAPVGWLHRLQRRSPAMEGRLEDEEEVEGLGGVESK